MPDWMDSTFWAFAGLIIFFLILMYFGVPKKISSSLDDRARKIADDLDEARRLREEAQELLAQYQRKQREAEDEAQSIIDQAKADARRIGEETRKKLAEELERRTAQAEDKIARAEAQAAAEVRNLAADVAIAAAETVLSEKTNGAAGDKLVDNAIGEIKGRLN
ncbi:MAG: F0F1 ATP synthase subunit B [Pseudomonadota bacterium]